MRCATELAFYAHLGSEPHGPHARIHPLLWRGWQSYDGTALMGTYTKTDSTTIDGRAVYARWL